MANKLVIWITDHVNLSGLQKLQVELKRVHSAASATVAAIKTGFEAVKTTFEIIFLPLRKIALPALGAVTTAFGLAIKAVREFAGQELGEADVKSALIAMGQYTDQYRDQLIKLADTYQTTTGIADDMWLKSLGQLTRFGMNASNVDRVSEALKNLTGLMDGNLDGATDMLAKAMQGEFGMFSRYGIIIQQTGDQVKDLDAAITAINSKGVGLLEARANTLAGKWNGLKTQANEVFEAIGKRLADSLEIGGAISNAKGWLATLTSSVQNGGLGDLISSGGKILREHIEKAVKKAEEIATAIQKSGKPLDQVFADAMHAAAEALMKSLTALLTASMAIWKAVGIAIFQAFKEQFLLLPGMGPIRDIAAGNAMNRMTTAERANFASDNGLFQEAKNGKPTGNIISAGPVSDERRAELSAKMATYDSEAKIKAALQEGAEKLKQVGDQLKTDLNTIVDKATGVKKDGSPATPEKSMITIQGSDGEEITIALDEYIKQLAAQNDKLTEAAAKGTEQSEKATETVEGIKKTTEESTKSLDAVRESNAKVQDALNTSKTLSQQTVLVAQRTQGDLDALVGMVSQIAANQSRTAYDLGILKSQVRSMRA